MLEKEGNRRKRRLSHLVCRSQPFRSTVLSGANDQMIRAMRYLPLISRSLSTWRSQILLERQKVRSKKVTGTPRKGPSSSVPTMAMAPSSTKCPLRCRARSFISSRKKYHGSLRRRKMRSHCHWVPQLATPR